MRMFTRFAPLLLVGVLASPAVVPAALAEHRPADHHVAAHLAADVPSHDLLSPGSDPKPGLPPTGDGTPPSDPKPGLPTGDDGTPPSDPKPGT